MKVKEMINTQLCIFYAYRTQGISYIAINSALGFIGGETNDSNKLSGM